jgi:HTH-type transcriptional regulator/antitoxin HigA
MVMILPIPAVLSIALNLHQAQTKKENQAMTDTATRDLDVLTPAWRELEILTSVRLHDIENERHYRAMVNFMNELLDKVGDRETHPLMGLLDIVTAFVHDYEERNVEIPDANPSTVLRFLMEQHALRQTDLAKDFGSQSNVSEVLNGKREINARQARSLATRFGVSPAVFI